MAFKGKGGRKDGREGRAGEPHAAPQGIRACSLPLSTLSVSHLLSVTILRLTGKESSLGHKGLYFTTPPASSISMQTKLLKKGSYALNWPALSNCLHEDISCWLLIFLLRPIWTFSSQNLHVVLLPTRSVSEGSNFSDGHHKLPLLYLPFLCGLPLILIWGFGCVASPPLIQCWYMVLGKL